MTEQTAEAPPEPVLEVPTLSLAERAADPTGGLQLADEFWTPERREQVGRFLGVKEDNPAMVPFLSIAAQMGLNPFLGEIWLIETKQRRKDGDAGTPKYTPAVGRDGLLKAARRTPEYEGYEAQVVRVGDEFTMAYSGGEDDPQIHHVQGGTVTEQGPGKIVGAWCKVHVRGQRPTFYYAPYREHARTGTNSQGEKYLVGAWAYSSAMILKAAVSYAHRLAIGVGGFLPVDEMQDGEHILEGTAVEQTPAERAVSLTEELGSILQAETTLSEELRAQLVPALEEANSLSPFSWGPAKVRMRLAGKAEEDGLRVLEEVRHQVEADRKRDAKRAEQVEREAAVEDAAVVVRAEDLEPGSVVIWRDEPEEVVEIAEAEGEAETLTVVLDGSGPQEVPRGAEFPLA